MDMIERCKLIARETDAGEFLYATNTEQTKYHFTYCERIRPGYSWLTPNQVVLISDQINNGTWEY